MARAWTEPDSNGRIKRTLRDGVEAMIWFSSLNQHWVFHLCCPRRGLAVGYSYSLRSAKINATREAKTTSKLTWTKLRPDKVNLNEHS